MSFTISPALANNIIIITSQSANSGGAGLHGGYAVSTNNSSTYTITNDFTTNNNSLDYDFIIIGTAAS